MAGNLRTLRAVYPQCHRATLTVSMFNAELFANRDKPSFVVFNKTVSQNTYTVFQVTNFDFVNKPLSQCSLTFLVYLFISVARISYGRFIAIRYKFKRPTYILEPMVIGGVVYKRET
jgi:hypothetical protein